MAIQTGGINYRVSRALATTTGAIQATATAADPLISTLHINMMLRAEISGRVVELASPMAACGSACRRDVSGNVDILRFAKNGSGPIPGGAGVIASGAGPLFRALGFPEPRLQWLVTMQQGALMLGTADVTALAAGQPAEFTLHGRMLLQYQLLPGGERVRLLSRSEPFFSGTVTQWPPRGARLSLTNAPIEYFREDEIERPNATPALRILSNDIEFGNDPVSLLSVRPEITRAQYVDADKQPWAAGKSIGGVSLSWSDTRSMVSPSDPPVKFYHVYRKFDGDDLNGWVLVRSLPADITTWVDNTPNGSAAVEYIVLHAAQYPFGHRYESLIGPSVLVPSVTS
jgi:hypothetical protein